jgi:hypothetical protein
MSATEEKLTCPTGELSGTSGADNCACPEGEKKLSRMLSVERGHGESINSASVGVLNAELLVTGDAGEGVEPGAAEETGAAVGIAGTSDVTCKDPLAMGRGLRTWRACGDCLEARGMGMIPEGV